MDTSSAGQNVIVLALSAWIHKDNLIILKSGKKIFHKPGSWEKKMVWNDDTTRGFVGYNYFTKKPAQMLEWLQKYIYDSGR